MSARGRVNRRSNDQGWGARGGKCSTGTAESPRWNRGQHDLVVAYQRTGARRRSAYLFGASAAADLFVAFRIPNFFRRLFAEGAFNQAFVPVLMEYTAKGHEELRLFLAQLSGVFALILTIVVIAGLALAGPLAAIFAPGFLDQPARFAKLTELLRITFPYLGLISLTAYAGALQNAHGRFALPAFTPVMLNLCLTLAAIIALVGQLNSPPIVILAWGARCRHFAIADAVAFVGAPALVAQTYNRYQPPRDKAGRKLAGARYIFGLRRAD